MLAHGYRTVRVALGVLFYSYIHALTFHLTDRSLAGFLICFIAVLCQQRCSQHFLQLLQNKSLQGAKPILRAKQLLLLLDLLHMCRLLFSILLGPKHPEAWPKVLNIKTWHPDEDLFSGYTILKMFWAMVCFCLLEGGKCSKINGLTLEINSCL